MISHFINMKQHLPLGKGGAQTKRRKFLYNGIIEKIAASSMLHEAKIAFYAFDAAILFASSIGPAVAKAT